MIRLYCVLVFICALRCQSVHAEIADLVVPGGAGWDSYQQVTIEKETRLSGPTWIEADEVVLRTNITLYTQGHPLVIETRRLVFEDGARILTFSDPATTGATGPSYAAPAASGGNEQPGASGSDGQNGFDGIPGLGSSNGVPPGEIRVFAVEIIGTPTILGIGQRGGKGGKGGQGQSGGMGGPGRNAVARTVVIPGITGDRYPGTDGGAGGAFGKGGKGGQGGLGGLAVPIALRLAWVTETSGAIYSQPGEGGEPGDAGDPGAPGAGGTGGLPDAAETRILFTVARDFQPGGNPGKKGLACKSDESENHLCQAGDNPCMVSSCTLGNGPSGLSAGPTEKETLLKFIRRERSLLIKDFQPFESLRENTAVSWYDFHWVRTIERLTHITLALTDDLQALESEIDSEESVLKALDKKISSDLAQVARQTWFDSFLHPLEISWRRYTRTNNQQALKRLEWARLHGQRVSDLLTRLEAATPDPNTKQSWTSLAKEIQTRRNELLSSSVELCKRYTKEVLDSEVYKAELLGYTFHFDLPVCRQADEFLASREATLSPIVLAQPLEPKIPVEYGSTMVMKKVTPQLRPSDKTAWLPNFLWNGLKSFFVPLAWAGEPEKVNPIIVSLAESNQRYLSQAYPGGNMRTRIATGFGLSKAYTVPGLSQIRNFRMLGEHLRALAAGAGNE